MRDPLTNPNEHPPDCGDAARELLPALLHGRLAGAERARAEAHVAACAECAAEFALLADARSALVAAGPAVDVAAVAASVRAATVPRVAPVVQAHPAPTPASLRRPSRWRAARGWRALAAGLVLAIGSGAVAVGRGGWGLTGPEVGMVRSADSAIAAGRGGPAAVARASVDTGVPTGRVAASGGSSIVRSAPVHLADAGPALGTRFDDLSDDELQAVLDAVEGASGTLPDAEPEEPAPAVEPSGAR